MTKKDQCCEDYCGISNNKHYCSITDLFDNYDDCPCLKCLVRVICNKVCQERVDYYRKRMKYFKQ